MKRWPELRDAGTAVDRSKKFTLLLDKETAAIKVKFKAAPEFVQHALVAATLDLMSNELYNIHNPREWDEHYAQWSTNESLLWLSEKLWITSLNLGGIK